MKNVFESFNNFYESKTNESKKIYPDYLDKNDFGIVIKNIKDLKINQKYFIKDLGMNAWNGDLKFVKIIDNRYFFISVAQDDNTEQIYTKPDILEMIKDKEIIEQK